MHLWKKFFTLAHVLKFEGPKQGNTTIDLGITETSHRIQKCEIEWEEPAGRELYLAVKQL
jgi:hypothetical protein